MALKTSDCESRLRRFRIVRFQGAGHKTRLKTSLPGPGEKATGRSFGSVRCLFGVVCFAACGWLRFRGFEVTIFRRLDLLVLRGCDVCSFSGGSICTSTQTPQSKCKSTSICTITRANCTSISTIPSANCTCHLRLLKCKLHMPFSLQKLDLHQQACEIAEKGRFWCKLRFQSANGKCDLHLEWCKCKWQVQFALKMLQIQVQFELGMVQIQVQNQKVCFFFYLKGVCARMYASLGCGALSSQMNCWVHLFEYIFSSWACRWILIKHPFLKSPFLGS